MAVNIQAPLANQLFALGQTVGAQGNNQVTGQADVGGFRNRAPAPMAPQQGGSGGTGALASVGAAMGAGLMDKLKGTPQTDEKGNGFALGGNLVSGDMGNASYAQSPTAMQGLMSLFGG